MPDVRAGSPIVETIAIFVIVFILQIIATALSIGLLVGLFVLSAPLASEPWTIVTSVYAHAGTGHLISNTIALVIFGWPIARATTRLRFHAFFVTTGAIAGIAQITITAGGVWGASGAVFALLGYLIAGNRLSQGLGSYVDVPAWMTVIVFLVLAAVVTIATGQPGVALVAHFTGFLLGLLAGWMGILRPKSRKSRRGQAA